MNEVIAILALLVVSVRATCTPSPTNICVTLDFFDGETGYYYLDTGNGPKGPSPTIQAYIGQTITFDQKHQSYVGFFKHSKDHNNTAYEFFTHKGPLAVLPAPSGNKKKINFYLFI